MRKIYYALVLLLLISLTVNIGVQAGFHGNQYANQMMENWDVFGKRRKRWADISLDNQVKRIGNSHNKIAAVKIHEETGGNQPPTAQQQHFGNMNRKRFTDPQVAEYIKNFNVGGFFKKGLNFGQYGNTGGFFRT